MPMRDRFWFLIVVGRGGTDSEYGVLCAAVEPQD
jgi:hypothetical protein